MKRRHFLLTTGLAAVAGCSSQGDTEEDAEDSATTSSSPQTTETPEPESDPSPIIDEASLLTHWESFGDVLQNSVDSVGNESLAVVGVRYEIPVHDGQVEEFVQTTVYHDGASVDSRSQSETRLVDEDAQTQTYERWEGFDTTNWDLGSYVVETIVRDETSNKNSNTREFEFEVIEPLGAGEVELTSIESPPNIQTGDEITMTLNLRNETDEDNSVVSRLAYQYENNDWRAFEEKLKINIPAGETRAFESDTFSFDYAGTHRFRLIDIDEEWSLTVSN